MSIGKISSTGLALLAMSVTATAKDRTEIVKFPKGATSTTLKGTVKGRDVTTYMIDARAGQVMHVLFASSNRSCYFNLFEPSAVEATHIGSITGNEFGKNLTASGAYTAQVYLMRNAARRNETCRYQLSIEITGAPGGVSAGVADTVMRDTCKGSAAPMYGVQPRNVTLNPAVVPAADGGFIIDGSVDKGTEGVKKLRCIFKPNRELNRVMAMTPDGE